MLGVAARIRAATSDGRRRGRGGGRRV